MFFRVALNVGDTEARNKPGVAGVLSENLVSPPLSSRGGEGENYKIAELKDPPRKISLIGAGNTAG